VAVSSIINVRYRDMSGTGRVLGGSISTVAVGAAVLPNTGGNVVVTLAIAVAAGLLTWGALYAYMNRKSA
jgi:LPXTG-motif cell wall-anchored protein